MAILCALAACGLFQGVFACGAFAQNSAPGFAGRQSMAPSYPGGEKPAAPSKAARPAVQPAAFDEGVLPAPLEGDPAAMAAGPGAGERIYYEGFPEGPSAEDYGYVDGAACGPDCCPPCSPCCSGFYVRAEYIFFGLKGLDLPPLVTTSPEDTDSENAGVLGEEGTRILFGRDSVNSDVQSGGRLTVGVWCDPCRRLGIEADYFAIGDQTAGFHRASDGDPILARPFYDVVAGTENASQVAFPNIIAGQIEARARTRFVGAGVRGIYNLCNGTGCGTSCITCCPVSTAYRFDFITGYRFLRVDDRLTVVEDSTSLETAAPGSFLIRDEFETENQFHGWDLGTSFNCCKGCWSVDLLSKIAIGNTRSNVNISGSTVITDDTGSETFTGGFLAQRTNIGRREFDEFAVVPELGVMVGYQINPCWRATLGYTFIYWSRVARAGDQIDRDLNPDLLPPEEGEVDTHLRPEFVLNYTDFWAQGMTVGLEGSW
jgi:hypothetical protein